MGTVRRYVKHIRKPKLTNGGGAAAAADDDGYGIYIYIVYIVEVLVNLVSPWINSFSCSRHSLSFIESREVNWPGRDTKQLSLHPQEVPVCCSADPVCMCLYLCGCKAHFNLTV
jgi:hypothetical protein